MNRKKKTLRLTLTAFFVAIELVFTLTSIGYIPFGALRLTTMHIPVILGGIVLGPATGAGLGALFGITSLLKATFEPGITSFVFSPFITIGGQSGNFWSLVIVLVPRILLGYIGGWLYRKLNQIQKHTYLSAAVSSALSTLSHTLLVLGGIYVFFGEQYGEVLGIGKAGVAAALGVTISTNGLLEMVLAAVLIPAIVKALTPILERMDFDD